MQESSSTYDEQTVFVFDRGTQDCITGEGTCVGSEDAGILKYVRRANRVCV